MAEKKNKIFFEVEVDGKVLKLAVRRPTPSEQTEAQKEKNRALSQAINSGAILREEVAKVVKSRNLWTDEDQKKWDVLRKELLDGELKLKGGGMKTSEARKLAIELMDKRDALNDLRSGINLLSRESAQAQAEDVEYRYLLSQCVIDADTGERYFNNYQVFLQVQDTDPVVAVAHGHFADLYYDLDTDSQFKTTEVAFLLKHKMAVIHTTKKGAKELRFVDKDGNFIWKDGKRIDGEGKYIDNLGRRVDVYGNLIDKDGGYIVDEKPLIED